MKVYISGKITGEEASDTFLKFLLANLELKRQGHITMNPYVLSENPGFEHSDYMHICYSMLDVCDAIYMLSDWQKSKGARMELQYAADHSKGIFYEDENTREKNFPIFYEHPLKGSGAEE